jgi:uncharacterized protein YjiK/2',3'-cyclic-nucleotide 2'-phosphodiesterase (5'-nucleotidase family)
MANFTTVDLSTYVRVGRYDLPEPTRTTPPANSRLAQEVSAVTYNWDTDTLFVVGDGSTSIVQVSKTGQLIDSMTLAPGGSPQGTEFYDTEGLTYIGNGKFVMVEERDRQAVLFTYTPGTTLTRGATQTVKLGTTVGNIGLEGISYDPATSGYIAVKEITPEGIFQTGIDFAAGTATNGSPTTVNSIDLFNPVLAGLTDFADVFALSNVLPTTSTDYGNLLILSQEDGKIVEVDRTGKILSSLTIRSDVGNPLSIANQQHEGLTMDRNGFLYVTNENGGGSINFPQLWVYAPTTAPNQAPTAVVFNNPITTITQSTNTTTAVKLADIAIADDGLGTNILSITGTDANFFEILNSGLYLKAGTTLNATTKASYNITVNVDDPTVGTTPDASTAFNLAVTGAVAPPSLIISEVAPWSSGSSSLAADWFEVTNIGTSAVNITGWKMDDNSNSFASSVPLSGITSIGAGESVIFIEGTNQTALSNAFKTLWFGNNPPANLQIGTYNGAGVGLSTNGDAVNLFDDQGALKANVSFGTAPAAAPFATFSNTAGLNNATITQLSSVGVNGGFVAASSANEIGSPGAIVNKTAYTLQLLHYYGESGLLGIETAPIMGALIDQFDDQYGNTLVLGEGDSYIPGPWLVGGSDPSLNGIPGIGSTALGRPDIAIMNAFGTNASALGNHEFDLGSPVLQGAIAASGAWVGAQFPFITANLDFTADSSLRGLADKTLGGTATNAFAGQEASAIKGKIAPYTVVTKGGEKIGIIGATTYDLLSKSSPNGTVPKDDGNPNTDDLQEVAAYIQAAVDALRATGINKIVMLDQLDTIERNKLLAPLVSGIDVMVAGGGHERMGDATDKAVGFNGHTADFIPDAYPIVTAGADGKPTLIVTTDTEYTYLGRLVVDFDVNGEIIVPNLKPAINGAYASTEANLQAAYGTTQTAQQIIAGSTIGSKVNAITQAINNVVTAKDGTIYGYTNVYLEGDRAFGRAQEVNLGDITADANLFKASQAVGNGVVLASMKNGGGLRASIGAIDETGKKVPPTASNVKPAGAISQLDIENALRFDNKLMVFDTTPQGLLNILNYAAGLAPGNGGYIQVGGVRFSYDPTKAVGQRVQDVAIYDGNGSLVTRIADNGVLLPSAPPKITVTALNFTANGGDGYPIKANADNFRYLLTDGKLSAPIDKSLDFTVAANIPANALGEQKAFADFLQANYNTPQKAYSVADTPATQDQRIQNLQVKVEDTVLPPAIAITEVSPWSSGNSRYTADWFEVTNTGTTRVDITGWKMDDDSNSAVSGVALNGITSIAPGESVIFIDTADLAATRKDFLDVWFGPNAPAGLQIGSYSGNGVGLSTSGDAVNLFDATGKRITGVSFGTSATGPIYATFDNQVGNGSTVLPLPTISITSSVGINGAFLAVNASEVGSPGTTSFNAVNGVVNGVVNGTAGRGTMTGTIYNDRIYGGFGADILTGGMGNDEFVYTSLRDAGDTITDFQVGQDKIVLSALLDTLVPTGYNRANALNDYVRVVPGSSSSNFSLQIDADGLGGPSSFRAFATVNLSGSGTLNAASNFVF